MTASIGRQLKIFLMAFVLSQAHFFEMNLADAFFISICFFECGTSSTTGVSLQEM